MLQNRQRIIIVQGVPSCGSMLIAMFRDEEGVDYVEMSAWHSNPNERDESFFQIEKLYMYDDHLSEQFVKSYPLEQGYVWVKNFYEKNVNKPKSLTV